MANTRTIVAPLAADFDMGGFKITNAGSPASGTDLATRQYVLDNAGGGLAGENRIDLHWTHTGGSGSKQTTLYTPSCTATQGLIIEVELHAVVTNGEFTTNEANDAAMWVRHELWSYDGSVSTYATALVQNETQHSYVGAASAWTCSLVSNTGSIVVATDVQSSTMQDTWRVWGFVRVSEAFTITVI